MGQQQEDVIAMALKAARRARDTEFLRILERPGDAEAFARLVDHPYLLPLAELVKNQCTSLAGARLLIENFLAYSSEIELARPIFCGLRVETLETTKVSRSELKACLAELCTVRQAEAFLDAVGRYRCIDNGYGVVPEASLVEKAIDISDTRLLRHVVRISSGQPSFSGSVLAIIEDSKYGYLLGDSCSGHSGKSIIDLNAIGK